MHEFYRVWRIGDDTDSAGVDITEETLKLAVEQARESRVLHDAWVAAGKS